MNHLDLVAITGRGEAQTIRLALLYAVLDGSAEHAGQILMRSW